MSKKPHDHQQRLQVALAANTKRSERHKIGRAVEGETRQRSIWRLSVTWKRESANQGYATLYFSEDWSHRDSTVVSEEIGLRKFWQNKTLADGTILRTALLRKYEGEWERAFVYRNTPSGEKNSPEWVFIPQMEEPIPFEDYIAQMRSLPEQCAITVSLNTNVDGYNARAIYQSATGYSHPRLSSNGLDVSTGEVSFYFAVADCIMRLKGFLKAKEMQYQTPLPWHTATLTLSKKHEYRKLADIAPDMTIKYFHDEPFKKWFNENFGYE